MFAVIASARRRLEGVPYEMPTSRPYNVTTPAITPTYDGSGQTVHPDVIDFHQILGADWRGWRYWMVVTPYPGGAVMFENPSILVSRDGFHWRVPPGGTNPVYPHPGGDYQSDPDMVYDPMNDELVMTWRPTTSSVAVGRSYSGITWSPAVGAVRFSLPSQPGAPFVSPSMVRQSDGSWLIWGVSNGSPTKLVMYSTNNLAAWGTPVECDADLPGLHQHWHVDVIKHDSRYWMLTNSLQGGGVLFAASSEDGVDWTVNLEPVVTNLGTYRGTLQPHENGTHMRVWYSVEGWRTFYTQVPLTEWPTP